MKILALVLAVVFSGSTLAACSASGPQAHRGPVRSVAAHAVHRAQVANLDEVCDDVELAFRDGTRGDVSQAAGIASELRGMMDVSDERANRLLAPLQRASDEIGNSRGQRETVAQHRTMSRAYRQMKKTCAGLVAHQ